VTVVSRNCQTIPILASAVLIQSKRSFENLMSAEKKWPRMIGLLKSMRITKEEYTVTDVRNIMMRTIAHLNKKSAVERGCVVF
jgi:hypothetical protein